MGLISEAQIGVFILVLARVGGVVVAAPVFGSRQVPAQAKIGLAVMLSLIFTPLLMNWRRLPRWRRPRSTRSR